MQALPSHKPLPSVSARCCLQSPLAHCCSDSLLMCGRPEYFCSWAENGKACVTGALHRALTSGRCGGRSTASEAEQALARLMRVFLGAVLLSYSSEP
jgi:hypothetical protein